MRKKLFVTGIILLLTGYAFSQNYQTSAGIRLGAFPGITLKHFIKEGHAIEGVVSTRWESLLIAGKYEIHKPLAEVPDLYWYIGGGGHIGMWEPHWDNDATGPVLGASFILGLEYVFPTVPFTISLDWNPAVNIIGPDPVWFDNAALSFRYRFK